MKIKKKPYQCPYYEDVNCPFIDSSGKNKIMDCFECKYGRTQTSNSIPLGIALVILALVVLYYMYTISHELE